MQQYEPERHSEIGWFSLDDLPSNLTKHAQQAIDGIINKKSYSVDR